MLNMPRDWISILGGVAEGLPGLSNGAGDGAARGRPPVSAA